MARANWHVLSRHTMKKVAEARNSIDKFYGFVMREEKTQARISPTPHQIVMFSFAEYHPDNVIRIPVGCGKTYFIVARALFLLGHNQTQRGVIMSASQGQSKKPLSMVSDYITDPELSINVALVFPHLRPSGRAQDPWTTEQITVERPPGIRDASLLAAGLETRISGSRISYGVGDDLVDDQNTFSPDVRKKTTRQFNARLMNRMDPEHYVTVCNTPFHREDLTYYLEEKEGWPTITMDIYGFVRFSNASTAWMEMALDKLLRPSKTKTNDSYDWYRLKAYDPDPEELTPLWPERYPYEKIQEIRYGKDGKGGMLPIEFARAFLCNPMSDDAARCNREWIEKCKVLGIGDTGEFNNENPKFTGVDLAVGKGRDHDRSTFFTIELLPNGSRRILDIDSGRLSGKEIVARCAEKAKRFGSIVSVENNNAQDYIRQFIQDEHKDIQVVAHTTTGANKRDVNWGVESIFHEIQNGAWIIPCDRSFKCSDEVQKFIDDCIYYQPSTHTGDHLMAAWIAREASRTRVRKTSKPWTGKKRAMTSTGSF